MQMKIRSRAIATLSMGLLALTAVACSNGPEASPSATASGRSSPTARPSPKVSVAFFWVSAGTNTYFRFAAPIVNPGSQTLNGTVVSWTAYDSSGAIVGSLNHHCPPIGTHSTQMYVGGAGSASLSGVPAKVAVEISALGQFVDTVPPTFSVTSVQFTQGSFQDPSAPPGNITYEVTGDITISGDSVQSASLNIPIILTDGNGAIVGADFYQPDNLPATLDPGTKFRVDDSDVIATAAPAAASITAGIDPTP